MDTTPIISQFEKRLSTIKIYIMPLQLQQNDSDLDLYNYSSYGSRSNINPRNSFQKPVKKYSSYDVLSEDKTMSTLSSKSSSSTVYSMDSYEDDYGQDTYFELNPNNHSMLSGRSRSNATTILHKNTLNDFSYSMASISSKLNYPTKKQLTGESKTVCETFSSAESGLNIDHMISLSSSSRCHSNMAKDSDEKLQDSDKKLQIRYSTYEDEQEYLGSEQLLSDFQYSNDLSELYTQNNMLVVEIDEDDDTSSQVVVVDTPYHVYENMEKKRNPKLNGGKEKFSFWERFSCGVCMVLP